MKKKERTLVFLKPDAIRNDLVGKVILLIRGQGLSIVEEKCYRPSAEEFSFHYEGIGKLRSRLCEKKGWEEGKLYYNQIIAYMQSEVLLFLIVEGENAIARMRALAGATRPWEAEEGSIRSIFGKKTQDEPVENVLHCSANAEEAQQEIALWFPDSSVI